MEITVFLTTLLDDRRIQIRPYPDPDLYLWPTDSDPDSGGPKTYGSYGVLSSPSFLFLKRTEHFFESVYTDLHYSFI